MNPEQQWQDIKENYLKQIEKVLAKTDHPRRVQLLCDVKEHLERKYADLPASQRTWENSQRIITEMGPPEDYAELLTEERPAASSHFGINELLAVVFVAVLIAIGAYLVYTAKKNPPEQPVPQSYLFEMDERVLGKWVAVDLVQFIDAFTPSIQSQQELYLMELEFTQDGTFAGRDRDKNYSGQWTHGRINPKAQRPAGYEIRNIEGKDYLFYEWISGDVTIRGMKPWYYVLVKEE